MKEIHTAPLHDPWVEMHKLIYFDFRWILEISFPNAAVGCWLAISNGVGVVSNFKSRYQEIGKIFFKGHLKLL